ncbi:MAG: hypothetical protein KC609_26275, partial [Myxococcales bacterium]|nr:hypothetical protein [Myxococcales bacterium]
VRLIRGDMRDGVAGPYELMTCPFRGFQHLVNLDDQRRALRGVRRALSAGGTFLFDLFYPSLELLRAPPRRVESVAHRDPQSGELAARFDSLAIDRRRQLLRVEMRWERQRSGLPAERLSQVSVSLRWFELPELELLLDDCDLRIVDVYGDFDGAPFDADSSELIVRCAPVARRPEREP